MSQPPPRPPPPSDTQFYSSATQLTSPASDSTPPPPPPKAINQQHNRQGTPHNGPPLPPTPRDVFVSDRPSTNRRPVDYPQPPAVEEAWLPELLQTKSKTDLETILQRPELLDALLHAPDTAHPSLSASNAQLQDLVSQNKSLARHLLAHSNTLTHQRADMTAKSLSLRALERQWHMKQAAMDDALSPFAPKAVHTRLVAGIQEQAGFLKAIEESFLEEDGRAGDREVAEFLRRWKEGRKVLDLREERRERFEEGRVGGWR